MPPHSTLGCKWPFKERKGGALVRFMDRVSPEPNTGCWLWLGQHDARGYGGFWLRTRTERAHRASLMLHGVEVPRDMLVLHSCDTPSCVNPAHLRVGTQKENIGDAIKRRRRDRVRPPLLRGERNNHAVLAEADVRAIRSILATPRSERPTLRQVASRFGVGRGAIKAIAQRKSWGWLQ